MAENQEEHNRKRKRSAAETPQVDDTAVQTGRKKSERLLPTRCRRPSWFVWIGWSVTASIVAMCDARRSSWPTTSWARRLAIRCGLLRRVHFPRASVGV